MSDDHHSMLCSFLKGLLGVSHLSDEIKENLKSKLSVLFYILATYLIICIVTYDCYRAVHNVVV